MTYAEKLKSPKWLKRKYAILERDKYTCKSCGDTERQLHVHHIFYLPNTDPWDYEDSALVTYCEYCHNTSHLVGNLIQDNLLEIIRNNNLLIRPLAQLCILSEKQDEFVDKLNDFVNQETVSYLASRKNDKIGK